MTSKLSMISLVFLFGVLFISPIAPAFIMMNGGVGSPPTLEASSKAPIVPSGPADWVSVSLESEYFYNDTAVISWSGEPRTVDQSPFNPLLNWTESGSIEGGFWDGNPGNATITAFALDNETTAAEVTDFLNYTATNYVPLDDWPSFSSVNFTEYENQTLWTFNDAIASHELFLNLTFYQVDNATGYLINGFNASGIAAAFSEYRIYFEWSDSNARLTFSYRIPGATELDGDTYRFSLGRAMGRTDPLTLNGSGTFTVDGPSDRMITDGLPVETFENATFPYFPIGIEEYDFNLNPRDFDYTVWFQLDHLLAVIPSHHFEPLGLSERSEKRQTIDLDLSSVTRHVPFKYKLPQSLRRYSASIDLQWIPTSRAILFDDLF